jgi:hypothetical protein
LERLALWFQTQVVLKPSGWKGTITTWPGIVPTVHATFLRLCDWIAVWWLLPRVMLLTTPVPDPAKA